MKTCNTTRNRNFLPLIMFILIGTFLSSCTMQKRRYSKGYHITWNVSLQSKKKRRPSEPVAVKEMTTKSAAEVIEVSSKTITDSIPAVNQSSISFNSNTPGSDVNSNFDKGAPTRIEKWINQSNLPIQFILEGSSKPLPNPKGESQEEIAAHASKMGHRSLLLTLIAFALFAMSPIFPLLILPGLVLLIIGFAQSRNAIKLLNATAERDGLGAAKAATVLFYIFLVTMILFFALAIAYMMAWG